MGEIVKKETDLCKICVNLVRNFRLLPISICTMMGLKFFLLTLVGLTFSSPLQNQHGHGHPPGVTEPGDCRKFSRFHESLLRAGYSFDDTCKHNKPIYECTIPVVEVLKKCVRGLHVNVQCVDHMFKKLYEEGHKKCFCGGFKKIAMMSRLVKEVYCSLGSSREGRGMGLLDFLTTFLAELEAKTTTSTTSTTSTTTTTPTTTTTTTPTTTTTTTTT